MNNQNQSRFFYKGISTSIGILIIVVFAVLVGGILAWQFDWFKKEVQTPEVMIPKEEVKTPEEKMIEDETANWKIYQSPTMGFFMKYPSDWTTAGEGNEDGGKRVTFQGPEEVEFVVMRGQNNYSYEKSKELTCEELVDYYKTERKKIILDNLPAFMGSSISYSRATGPNPVKTTYICEESKKTEMYFTIYNYNEAKENLYFPIFNKMLSTFKITGVINFSESYTRQTLNWPVYKDWEVYRNDKYGFEIKYPPHEGYELSTENYTKVGSAIISRKQRIKIIFEIYDNLSSLSLSQWADAYNSSIKWRNILVNNVESLRSPMRACEDCKNWQDLKIPKEYLFIAAEWEILIYKKDKIVKVLFTGERVGAEDLTLDRILSTFRFIE